MSDTPSPTSHRPRAVALVLAALVVAGVVWHAGAVLSWRSSFSEASMASRLAASEQASVMEPWNDRFGVRSRWLAGLCLLAARDYKGAVRELRVAYREDVGNEALLADFKRAQDALALDTNRKAHLQHGHEGPGGTLRPEDIER